MNIDLREKIVPGEETHNRVVWRQLVTYIDPTLTGGEMLRRKKKITINT